VPNTTYKAALFLARYSNNQFKMARKENRPLGLVYEIGLLEAGTGEQSNAKF
jgi:hypothetical protein